MEGRQPLVLKYPLVLYNAALTILNFYIFKEVSGSLRLYSRHANTIAKCRTFPVCGLTKYFLVGDAAKEIY